MLVHMGPAEFSDCGVAIDTARTKARENGRIVYVLHKVSKAGERWRVSLAPHWKGWTVATLVDPDDDSRTAEPSNRPLTIPCKAGEPCDLFGREGKMHKTQSFEAELTEVFGGGEEAAQTWKDIARGGADAGWAGLTWNTDMVELYARHEAEIWEALANDAEENGFDSVPAFVATFSRKDMANDPTTFKALLCWYMAERVARTFEDEEA